MENKKLQEAIKHMEDYGFAQFRGKDAMENSVALEEHFKAKGKPLYQTSFEGSDFSYYDPHHPENKGKRYSAEHLSKQGYGFAQGGTTKSTDRRTQSYPTSFFLNKAAKAKADQENIMDIENEDLTKSGLLAKIEAWDEFNHGIEPYMYERFEKDLKKFGATMPKGVRRLAEGGTTKSTDMETTNDKRQTTNSANGGRPLSALARDRKYTSQEEWEKAYTPNRKSKVMTYNTKAEGGKAKSDINYSNKVTISDWSKQAGHKQYRVAVYGKVEDVGEGSVWTPRNDVPTIIIDDVNNKKSAYEKAVVILEKEYGVKINPVFTQAEFLHGDGGRPKSAIMRDRYNTNASEPWEVNYARKTKARNRAEGGRALSQWEQDEAYVKGNLVFAKNEGHRGLVGLIVSEHPTKLAQHNEVDVYFRGYNGETITMDTNELEPVENGHLGFAENNGDLLHYPNIAKKLGFELNPKYQQMNDEYNNPEHGFTDEDDFASGGRPKSAIMRDRYNTNKSEPWEVNYKRKTRARNRAEGGKAGKNRYWVGIPKEPEKVWDAWTKGQREHFIEDHFNSDSYRNSDKTKHHYFDSLIKFINKKFAEIPDVPVKSALEAAIYNHIQHPQYNYGGEIDELEDIEETYEPDWENDDFIEDKPSGGYSTSHAGKFIGEFETTGEALDALIEIRHNPKNNWLPTIWFVSDHGNYWAIDENGNEIKAAGGALGGGVVPFFQSIDLSKLPPNIRSVVEPVAHHKEIIYVREGDSSFEKFLTLKNLLETKFPDAIKKPEAEKPAPPKKPDVNVLKTRLLLINEMMKKADASKKSILKTRASIVREMIASAGKVGEKLYASGGKVEWKKAEVLGKDYLYTIHNGTIYAVSAGELNNGKADPDAIFIIDEDHFLTPESADHFKKKMQALFPDADIDAAMRVKAE